MLGIQTVLFRRITILASLMHLCQNGHYYKPHRASAEKVPYLKKKKKNSRNEGKAKKKKNEKKKIGTVEFFQQKKKEKKTGPKCGVWVIRCRK